MPLPKERILRKEKKIGNSKKVILKIEGVNETQRKVSIILL